MIKDVCTAIHLCADPEYAKKSTRFFKTGPGEYAEHDQFLGVRVPQLRELVRQFRGQLSTEDCCQLLQNKWHEIRLFALLALVNLYERGDAGTKKSIVSKYFKHKEHINNWDLVDSSAYKIPGAWYYDKDRSRLHKMITAKSLWERRIPVIATFYYIRQGDLEDTFSYASQLLTDTEDLTHKATGWMLREAGKRDTQRLRHFIDEHLHNMPRTMLRYAIEKLPAAERKALLKR